MKRVLIAACLLIVISSCYNDKYDKLYPAPSVTTVTTTCDTDTVISYQNDIYPIVEQNCFNPSSGTCHNAAGSATSTYNYETFSVFQANALNGWVVEDINFMPTRGHNSMPLNGTQLSACDINKITRWVNEGAPDN